MKEIPLTKGQVALVDDEDYNELMGFVWFFSNGGYAMTRITEQDKCKLVSMHRYLSFGLNKDSRQVDHLNGCKLDNRKSNLRPCTPKENMGNTSAHKRNKLGVKGVTAERGRFRVKFLYRHVGMYDTLEAAKAAFAAVSQAHYKEFAKV